MVQIYTQLIATFHDFGGILLGNCKLTQQEKEINVVRNSNQSLSNANKTKDIIITEINIESIVVVYDLITLTTIPTLISRISNEYPDKVIIGMFTAKSFSYSTISFKDQELHIYLGKYLRNELKSIYLSIPLLFALFIHSIKSTESIHHMTQFESKIYLYEEVKQVFEAVKFDITNMKFDNYNDLINPIANKAPRYLLITNKNNNQDNIIANGFEKEITQLKSEINKTLNEITISYLNQVQTFKKKLKRYLDKHIRLSNLVKSLNNE